MKVAAKSVISVATASGLCACLVYWEGDAQPGLSGQAAVHANHTTEIHFTSTFDADRPVVPSTWDFVFCPMSMDVVDWGVGQGDVVLSVVAVRTTNGVSEHETSHQYQWSDLVAAGDTGADSGILAWPRQNCPRVRLACEIDGGPCLEGVVVRLGLQGAEEAGVGWDAYTTGHGTEDAFSCRPDATFALRRDE